VSGLRVQILAIAMGLELAWNSSALAQEPQTARTGAELQPLHLSVENNIERLLKIRLAFQKDPVIGPLNLGIQYRDGLVTLWGPVSHPKHIQVAKALAAAQKGVIEVRSELYVGVTGERQTGPSTLVAEIPVRVQAASPNAQGQFPNDPLREDPVVLQARDARPGTRSATQNHANALPSGLPAVVPTGQVLRFPGSEPGGQAATTGLGTGAPGSDSVMRSSAFEQRPAAIPLGFKPEGEPREPARPVNQRPSLESPSERLLQIRSTSDRFRGITWSLRGAELEIQYGTSDAASALDFARSAQILPGIRSVALRQRAALAP